MTSSYRRDHEPFPRNDEFERVSSAGRAVIETAADGFMDDTWIEAIQYHPVTNPNGVREPSAGEQLALRRAMARFVIDSGIASARGWL